MVKITRKERFELEKMGVPMGENGISHTYGKGRKRTYYLCESYVNMKTLSKIRQGK